MKILSNFLNNNNINQDKTNNILDKGKVMNSPLDQIINSSSVKAENGLKEALRVLKNENIKIDNNTVKEVNSFLKNAEGSLDSKLDTITYASKKGVDITEKNLTAMQSALNDNMNTSELIQTLTNTKESDLKGDEAIKKVDDMDLPDDIKTKIKKELSNNKTLKEAVTKVLSDKLNMDIRLEDGSIVLKSQGSDRFLNLKDMINLLESASKIIDKFGSKGLDMIKDLLASDLRGENIVKALKFIENADMKIENIKSEIDQIIGANQTKEEDQLKGESKLEMVSNDEIKDQDPNYKSQFTEKNERKEEALRELKELSDDISNDDVQVHMLENLESILSQVTSDIQEDNLMLDQLTSLIEGNSNFKFFVVKEITQKIIDVKEEFSDFQKDMRNTIDDVLIEPGKTKEVSKGEMLELIAKATQKLDDIIMKSDITLYTSMKGERDLVKMSSDLLEARNMLGKSNIKAALDIIKNVRTNIENMKFDPSITKVEGHLQDKARSLIDLNNQNYTMTQKDLSPSGRGVLELMRSLGLNHEYEVSEKLHHELLKEDSALKDNAKMALLKIMQDKSDSSKAIDGVEKSLNNLTGQQLLNRNNPNSDKQTLMFNIPIETPAETKNLKIYLNGKEKSNSLDWENCSLYFVIETNNYGMTGLKIDIKDRSVNLTIRNDDETIKKVAEPLVDEVLNEFTEIGLKKGSVNFRKLNLDETSGQKDKVTDKLVKEKSTNLTEVEKESKKAMEGFDFKI